MSNFDFRHVLRTCYTDEQIARLASVRVGIAGAGGLGSNCAVALVRSGIQQLVVADFDVVEPGNLNRQAYSACHLGRPKVECLREVLLAINPQLRVDAVQQRLDAAGARQLFASCQAVVEAFDQAAAKAMLASVFLRSGRCYVTASGLAGIGDSDAIRSRQLGPSAWLIGDEKSGVSADLLPYAPRVQIAAAKQADLVVNWVLQQDGTSTD